MEMGTCLRYLEAKMDNAFGTNFKFYTKYKERWQNVWNNYLEPLFVDLTAKLLNIEFLDDDSRELTEIGLKDDLPSAEITCLFSGGADSAAGAYLLTSQNHSIILVHTYHRSMIKENLNEISREINPISYYEIGEEFDKEIDYRNWTIKTDSKINLSQIRSITYIFNAIPFAVAHRSEIIAIPENGPLTLNIPYSELFNFTRTSDPFLVYKMNEVLRNLLPEFDLKIFVPFAKYTKAEIINSVPSHIIELSHSCSYHSGEFNSCSSCFACLVRRSSLYVQNKSDSKIFVDPERTKNRYNPDYLLNSNIISKRRNDMDNQDISKAIFIDFMDFCGRILKEQMKPDEQSRIREIELTLPFNYYNNINDLMKRFAKDTLFGFYLFLDQQPNKFDLESYRTLLYILSEIYLQEDLLNEINARQQEIEDIGHQITPIL